MAINLKTASKAGFELRPCDGELAVFCGDEVFRPTIHTIDPYRGRPWEDSIRKMAEDGVQVISYLYPLVLAWDNPNGEMDFTLLDELEERVIAAAPKAFLMPRIFMTTPTWWDEAHPEELMKPEGVPFHPTSFGHEDEPLWKYERKMYHDTTNPSMASAQWHTDAGNALTAYIRHAQAKHPGRYFAFQIAYGTCGEWGTFGSYYEGRCCNMDFSLPMVRQYRSFLKKRYKSDAELQATWQCTDVTLANVMPPTKLAQLSTNFGTLKEPRFHHELRDWADCVTETHRQALRAFCRCVKAASKTPALTCSFGGNLLQCGASMYRMHFHRDWVKAVDIPELDIVAFPNWYENRARGIASQGPVATLVKTKLFLAECDCRGWRPEGCERLAPTAFPRTPDEAYYSVYRDTFFNLTSGQGLFWWYDFGEGWYRTEDCRALVRAVVSLQKEQPTSGNHQAEIAVVIDNDSSIYAEGDIGHLKQFRFMLNEVLPETGYSYDVITWEDMLHAPAYKLYIFRDAFYCPNAHRKKIRAFMEKHHASCIWYHAAGGLAEEFIGVIDSPKLTGIKIQTHFACTSNAITLLKGDHPLCEGIPVPYVCADTGDTRTLSTLVFTANDPSAVVLGQLESLELPGIAVKYIDGRFDVWAAGAMLPVQFYANAAKLAGCTASAPVGVCVYGAGKRRAFWTREDRTVEIPWAGAKTLEDPVNHKKIKVVKGVAKLELKAYRPVLLVER